MNITFYSCNYNIFIEKTFESCTSGFDELILKYEQVKSRVCETLLNKKSHRKTPLNKRITASKYDFRCAVHPSAVRLPNNHNQYSMPQQGLVEVPRGI